MLAALFVAVLLAPLGTSTANAKDIGLCTINSTVIGVGEMNGVAVRGRCVSHDTGDGTVSVTKVLTCRYAITLPCVAPCLATDWSTGGLTTHRPYVTRTWFRGELVSENIWCPTDEVPKLALDAIGAHAIRLLPHAEIGSAWKHTGLVNTEVILWVATPAQRALPTVTVVGHRVQLRLTVEKVSWEFGDGQHDTWTQPGRPYDADADPCRTVQCPGYDGHTYTETGTMQLRATVTWHVQYRVGGRPWADLPDDLPGPTATHTLRIVEARGVLVQDP